MPEGRRVVMVMRQDVRGSDGKLDRYEIRRTVPIAACKRLPGHLHKADGLALAYAFDRCWTELDEALRRDATVIVEDHFPEPMNEDDLGILQACVTTLTMKLSAEARSQIQDALQNFEAAVNREVEHFAAAQDVDNLVNSESDSGFSMLEDDPDPIPVSGDKL